MVEIRGDGTIMRTLPKIQKSPTGSILVFSLLLGALLLLSAPSRAQAGFFSSILGNDASASADVSNSDQSMKSSHNMDLLQANVSSASIFQDPKGPRQGGASGAGKNNKKNKKDDEIDTNANVNIVSDNALLAVGGPTGVSDGNDALDSSCGETSIYLVKKDDSISKIAKMLDVSENTVLAANDMKKKLVEGDVLFIPSISGIKHTVVKGQTLQKIAKLYKVDINDIAFCNGITPDAKLMIDTELIIPGGEMADEGGDEPAPNLGAVQAKDKEYYATSTLKNADGYFIYPLPLGIGRKTQGLHGPGHRGIDYGAPKGTPIYASALGKVLIAKTGWNGKYGIIVIIEHPNGTKTLYAHMSKLGTYTGAEISQGQIIGYVGSTGHSTGPHLHIEVFYAKHPGVDGSWAQ